MNDESPVEPRIVQGVMAPITASELRRQMSGQDDPRDAEIAALKAKIEETDQVLDQYDKLLVEMKEAAETLSQTLGLVLDNLSKKR